jgi:hypothetical protein
MSQYWSTQGRAGRGQAAGAGYGEQRATNTGSAEQFRQQSRQTGYQQPQGGYGAPTQSFQPQYALPPSAGSYAGQQGGYGAPTQSFQPQYPKQPQQAPKGYSDSTASANPSSSRLSVSPPPEEAISKFSKDKNKTKCVLWVGKYAIKSSKLYGGEERSYIDNGILYVSKKTGIDNITKASVQSSMTPSHISSVDYYESVRNDEL